VDKIAAAFSDGAFAIVVIHGGREYRSVPQPDQIELYRDLADRGADLILGSHPHFLQGMEVRGRSLIVFSLGNFIFPGMHGTDYGEESIILRIGFFGSEIRYLEIVPVTLKKPPCASTEQKAFAVASSP
jgi:poly-gamma-glutamate synthesis protein (capsule biosynthesis protein)